jgi:hypothetical protein
VGCTEQRLDHVVVVDVLTAHHAAAETTGQLYDCCTILILT